MLILRRLIAAIVMIFGLSPSGCGGDKGTGTTPPPPPLGGNQVVVESRSVSRGAKSVKVGVYLANEIALTGLVLPLEFRAVTPGSYIADSCRFGAVSGRRVGASPLASMVVKRMLGAPGGKPCTGPTANTYAIDAPVDFVSPDGLLWAGVSTSALPDLFYLPPGNDNVAGQFADWPSQGESTDYAAGPSFEFTFNVTRTPGTFEIDTCCVLPANHLSGTDLQAGLVPLAFSKGVITLQ